MEPLADHQLLVFWVQLAVILVVARGLGGLMRRVGQPSVVGELAAGLVLGPTLLGRVAPEAYGWLFPTDPVHSGLLMGLAWLGAAFLLVVTGFETDLGLLRKLGRPAAFVSTGSLVVPLALGFAVGWAMPARFIGAEGTQTTFALFAGIALSISALPVIAKILMEMNLMRRNLGQLTVAAGISNDLVGYLLLGGVAGMVAAGGFDVVGLGTTMLLFAAFVALAFVPGQWALDQALRRARQGESGQERSFTVALLVVLACAAAAQAIGVEAVLGTLLAGIVLARSPYLRGETKHTFETLVNAFLAPVFFATAGLFVDLGLLVDPEVAVWTVIVLAAAAVSKLAGSYAGARLSRLSRLEGLAIGVGLNARGALQVVIATVGLGLGVLNTASYTVVMVTAIVTSMAAPPLLRAVLGRFETPPDEAARLDREAMLAQSVIARTRTALLPTRGGGNSVLAAQLLHQSLQPEASVTLLTVRAPGEENGEDRALADQAVAEARQLFAGRGVGRIDRRAHDPAEAIQAEASLGYGLMALGLTEGFAGSHALSPVLVRTIAGAPVPVLLVKHGAGVDGHEQPLDLRRILVPIAGTRIGQAAQEIGYTLGGRSRAAVDVLHVVNRADGNGPDAPDHERPEATGGVGAAPGGGTVAEPAAGGGSGVIAERVLRQAEELAGRFGCEVTALRRTAPSLGAEVVAAARERGSDLIVLGAAVRPTPDGLFLGHEVEYVLERAEQTVLVVVFPGASS